MVDPSHLLGDNLTGERLAPKRATKKTMMEILSAASFTLVGRRTKGGLSIRIQDRTPPPAKARGHKPAIACRATWALSFLQLKEGDLLRGQSRFKENRKV